MLRNVEDARGMELAGLKTSIPKAGVEESLRPPFSEEKFSCQAEGVFVQ